MDDNFKTGCISLVVVTFILSAASVAALLTIVMMGDDGVDPVVGCILFPGVLAFLPTTIIFISMIAVLVSNRERVARRSGGRPFQFSMRTLFMAGAGVCVISSAWAGVKWFLLAVVCWCIVGTIAAIWAMVRTLVRTGRRR